MEFSIESEIEQIKNNINHYYSYSICNYNSSLSFSFVICHYHSKIHAYILN